jgi:hypothetical protein
MEEAQICVHHIGKMFKAKWGKRMTKWANNQTPILDLAQKLQTCIMRIQRQVKKVVEKKPVMQKILIVFLKFIYTPFYKLM